MSTIEIIFSVITSGIKIEDNLIQTQNASSD